MAPDPKEAEGGRDTGGERGAGREHDGRGVDPQGGAVRLLPADGGSQRAMEPIEPRGRRRVRSRWRPFGRTSRPSQGADMAGVDQEPSLGDTDDGVTPDQELTGFGELRLDLPGPFAPTWRESLRRRLHLLILSHRAPQLRGSAVPFVAAAWAACAGLVCSAVLLAVSGVPFSAAGVAVVWLAGNHVPIDTDAGTVSLLPLALLLAALLPARRAGRFVAAQTEQRARSAGLLAAAVYAVLAAAAAIAVSSLGGSVAVAWPPALLWAGAVAVAGGAWGVVRESGRPWRPTTLTVAVGLTVAVPLFLGLLLMTVLGLTNLGTILAGQHRLVAGPAEHVGLGLLQLAYLPNLLVWAAAFVIGSGFAIGGGNRLAPFTDGQPFLPDLPVLAPIPSGVPTWTALLPLVVAATGALAAALLGRGAAEQPLGRRMARVAPIAAASGMCWALLALLSSGSVGDARLAHVGPSIATGAVAAVLVGAGGLLWAVLPTIASESRPRAADLRARVQGRDTAEPEPAPRTRGPAGKA